MRGEDKKNLVGILQNIETYQRHNFIRTKNFSISPLIFTNVSYYFADSAWITQKTGEIVSGRNETKRSGVFPSISKTINVILPRSGKIYICKKIAHASFSIIVMANWESINRVGAILFSHRLKTRFFFPLPWRRAPEFVYRHSKALHQYTSGSRNAAFGRAKIENARKRASIKLSMETVWIILSSLP